MEEEQLLQDQVRRSRDELILPARPALNVNVFLIAKSRSWEKQEVIDASGTS